MESHEPNRGMLVRVKEGQRKQRFGGMVGTVKDRWGHPDHPALDVRFADGSTELFWFHELDKAE